MKRKLSVLLCCLAAAAVIALFPGRDTLSEGTAELPYEEDGIIFSITVSDGKSETKPFVRCFGHAWVSVENRSGQSIYLKDHEIKDGEILTFSVWAISGHMGVTYNLEAAFINDRGRYGGRESLSMNIDEEDLKTTEEYIDANDTWTLIKNCSRWSAGLWNALADDEYDLEVKAIVFSPLKVLKAMKAVGTTETDRDVSSAGDIFFYRDGMLIEPELCL